jgi:uncharacterized protein
MPDHEVACTWEVEASRGLETAWVTLNAGSLAARGRAVGLEPEAYWVEYELETGESYVTTRLAVRVESGSGRRSLELVRSPAGAWQADGRALPHLTGAMDCDLAFCPLTNSMPVLRHRLHRDAGTHDLVMAFVSLPDLDVQRSDQAYEHLRRTGDGAVVRFASGAFTADIQVDEDGLVVRYPQIATRLARTPLQRG